MGEHLEPGGAKPPSTTSVSRAFWNTPPVSTTVSRPWARRRRRRRRRRRPRRRASWNPAAITASVARRGALGDQRGDQRRGIEHDHAVDRRRHGAVVARRVGRGRPCAPAPRARSPPAPRSCTSRGRRAAPRPRRTAGPRWSSPVPWPRRGEIEHRVRRRGVDAVGSRTAAAASGRPRASAHTAAIRHGSRIAGDPPGIGTARRWPTRSIPGEVGDEQLAAPQRAVGAVAEPVEGDAEHRLGAAVLDQAGGDVGVMVLHAPRRAGRGRAANLVDRYSGCRSWATTSGVTPYRPRRWSTAWRNDR